jgi:hypothetical protein
MLTTIAVALHTDVFALLDEPHWRNLYRFYHLVEREARERLSRRYERVDAGVMTAFAFNEPSRLDEERQAVVDAIRAIEHPTAVVLDDIRAKAEAMAARMATGKVLTPAALVS